MSVFKPGSTALISGAASGIGFAVAKLCRNHGMNLALLDINSAHLSKASSILKPLAKNNEKTETYAFDVSQLSEWQKIRPEVEKTFGTVELLMLNAGASFKPQGGNPWEDVEYHQKTYATNLHGPLNGLQTFLPLVQRSPHPSSIILTGSKQGITNPPGNPAYNASKAALKSLAESLAHSLRTSPHPSAAPSVHLLIPGWTFTGLSGNAGPTSDDDEEVMVAARGKKPEGAWMPSQVAEYAERMMGEGRFYIVCPDNDVSRELDQARMVWGVGDVVEGRPALSRWEEGWKGKAAEWIGEEAKRRAAG
ncbi:MAG: hypothetical protein Q9227_001810 [Pyrenula ochraceoflavens]